MPTLQELYQKYRTQRDTAQEDAYSQWVREQGDQANSFSPAELRQRWNELQNYDVNAGPGSINAGRLERDTVLGSGFIPIDNDIAYAAKEFGITIPELMQKYFPGGKFAQSTPGDFGAEGGGDRFYYQANQTGAPIDNSILMSLPRVPSQGRLSLMLESGLPLMAGAFGAGLMGLGGAGTGLMPTAAGETAGLAGSVTGGGASGLAGLGGIDLSGLANAPYEGFNSELFPGATQGGGDMFFEDILGELMGNPYEGFNSELFSGATSGGGDWGMSNFGDMESGFSAQTASDMAAQGYDITNLKTLFSPAEWQSALNSGLPNVPTKTLLDLLKSGVGSVGDIVKGVSGAAKDIFGNDVFGTLASIAPSLAAINYARNLGGPDTSRLESAYSSIDPNALALPYDIQTGKGREGLTSSLTQRGIMGSSFGNQDMASYDTLRQLGRQNLLTSGAGQQASIASQILAAQQAAQKNKLDLYGRSLLALSGGLNPARAGAF